MAIRLPGRPLNLIVVRSKGKPGPAGHGCSLGYIPPEVLRKYGNPKPLFRPRRRPFSKRPPEEKPDEPQ
jgi:hypothetical protein